MFRCPHCQQDGLRSLELALSTSWSPVRCRLCAKHAYTSTLYRFASAVVLEVGLYLCVGMALYFWSWWPFALLLVAMVVLPLGSLALPATPTTPQRVRRARWLQRGFVIAFVVATAFAAVGRH
jgi:hypothetical protein